MDALSDVLRVTHLTGGVFLHAEFFAPWCIAARVSPEHCALALGPASDLIIYHYVVEGDLAPLITNWPAHAGKALRRPLEIYALAHCGCVSRVLPMRPSGVGLSEAAGSACS